MFCTASATWRAADSQSRARSCLMIGPGRNTAPVSVLAGEAVGADGVEVAAGDDPPVVCATACELLPSARVHSGSATAAASVNRPTAAMAGRRRRITSTVSCARSYHSNQRPVNWLHRLVTVER